MNDGFAFFPVVLNYRYNREYVVVSCYNGKSFTIISEQDTLYESIEWIRRYIPNTPHNAVIYGWDAFRRHYRVLPIYCIVKEL